MVSPVCAVGKTLYGRVIGRTAVQNTPRNQVAKVILVLLSVLPLAQTSCCLLGPFILFVSPPETELLPDSVHARLCLSIHADLVGPAPRVAFRSPFPRGINSHLR